MCGLFVSYSIAHAGTMGAAATYPMGFLIGGDIGYGYLSTQESTLSEPAPYVSSFVTTGTDSGQLVQSRKLGSLVGGGYLGYELPLLERMFVGGEVGYKYMGRSSYSTQTFTNWTDQSIFNVTTSGASLLRQSVTVTQQAVDFLLTGKIYVWDKVNIFGKAGAAYVFSQTKQQFSSDFTASFNRVNLQDDIFLNPNPTIWRIKPELQIGAGYLFTDHLDAHLNYTYIGGTDGNTNGAAGFYANQFVANNPGVFQYNALTAGLSYHF